MNNIFLQIYAIHSTFQSWIFKELTSLSLKLIKYFKKRKRIQDVMLIYCKTFITKRLHV